MVFPNQELHCCQERQEFLNRPAGIPRFPLRAGTFLAGARNALYKEESSE